MMRKHVLSSDLVSVGYEEAARVLEVEFKRGLYRFYKVPPERFDGLMMATSKGAYFHEFIKKNYAYCRIW